MTHPAGRPLTPPDTPRHFVSIQGVSATNKKSRTLPMAGIENFWTHTHEEENFSFVLERDGLDTSKNMQEPILEALTFAYQGIEISGGTDDTRLSATTQQLDKTLQDFSSQSVTPCPFKSCAFELVGLTDPLCENYTTTQAFLKHFLVQHNLVVDNVPSIASLHRYLLCLGGIFGRPEFQLENYCVGFWMDQPLTAVEAVQKDTLPEGSESSQNSEAETRHKYYMLTPAVPEDKDLRAQLWSQRLESVLEINRLEREQNDFSYKCPLFCKEVCKGNRANLFLHMAEEHAFHVGQPDNIVFVKDFLLQIEKQLEELKCIYCEKTFKDRATLKEHMRKKLHKRINPLNPEYDRFYMVNYLEVGKTWQALQEEDVDEERIEEDWKELKDEKNQIVCLLCPQQLDSFDQTLAHMGTVHRFDFKFLTAKYNFYQKVKLVNFIRRNVYQSRCFYCETKCEGRENLTRHIEDHQSSNSELPDRTIWDQSEYLFPTYENDEFLMFLGDDDESESAQDSDSSSMDTAVGYGENPRIIPEDLAEISIPPVIQLPPDLDLDLF